MISLSNVNALPETKFVTDFGDVAEHSPWVAQRAKRPFATRAHMIAEFNRVVCEAAKSDQLQLLRAHPDLATRAKLTVDSSLEQQGAGLDTLDALEFATFTALNNQYKEQNGFPFIFAVKGATKHAILASFEARIHNSKEAEFAMALQQVCKIIGFRIEARVGP
jgi:2-oxo-4-hydroxy-4-carboxy-5-ureidoimidazoline decarboxylase